MYQPDILAEEEGKELLKIARDILERFVRNEKTGKPKDYPCNFNNNSGVLCTLVKDGNVRGRGSSGTPYPILPIIDATLHAIVSAAHSKGNEPLSASELKGIKIEIDVLTEPRSIHARNAAETLANVLPGTDGLMIRYGVYESFLMPRDWASMSKEEFLGQLCLQAGMTRDMWKEPGTELYKFHAQVFREE